MLKQEDIRTLQYLFVVSHVVIAVLKNVNAHPILVTSCRPFEKFTSAVTESFFGILMSVFIDAYSASHFVTFLFIVFPDSVSH